jgi:hypothetical protein
MDYFGSYRVSISLKFNLYCGLNSPCQKPDVIRTEQDLLPSAFCLRLILQFHAKMHQIFENLANVLLDLLLAIG